MGLNGFTREVTTVDTVTHPSAYTKVSRVVIDNTAKRATVSIITWDSQAAKAAGGAPLGGMVENSVWRATGDDWDTYFAPEVVDSAGKNDRSQAYNFVKAKLNDPSVADVVV